MMQLGAKVNLVVCQKSKVEDWCEHFLNNYAIAVYKLTDGIYAFISSLERMPDGIRVGVINYDLLWRRKELLTLENFTLICDESGLISNETAKRTKAVMKLKAKNVLLLSGTICGGKYERLWSQMHLLGWDISKKLYWNTFVNVEYLDTVGGKSIPIVTGYKNVERLKRKMREHGCQFLKTDEVFDLPEQVFQQVKVDQSKQYKTFRKKRIVDIDGKTLVGDTTLTKMLHERQLCGQYSEEKLKAYTDLLDSTEERLVVFYNFTDELKALQKLTDRPQSVVNGETKDLSAYEQHEDSVTFVQYQAGAMGLNLQKSCRMIFYSLPLSSELFEQAKKRIHRIGQQHTCFYYILMCRGSIEEKVLATLEKRQNYTEKLFEQDEYT